MAVTVVFGGNGCLGRDIIRQFKANGLVSCLQFLLHCIVFIERIMSSENSIS